MASERLTDETLAELERLEREATPRPWRRRKQSDVHLVEASDATVCQVSYRPPPRETVNGELIAAARNALPLLLAEARASRAAPDPGEERRLAYERGFRAAVGASAKAGNIHDNPYLSAHFSATYHVANDDGTAPDVQWCVNCDAALCPQCRGLLWQPPSSPHSAMHGVCCCAALTSSSSAPAALGREGEQCQDCGQRHADVWRAPDALWVAVTGQAGAGLRCMSCFAASAWSKGVNLCWECAVDAWPSASAPATGAPAREAVIAALYRACPFEPGNGCRRCRVCDAAEQVARLRSGAPAGRGEKESERE